MPNAQYRNAVETLMKSLTDYYGNADFSDTAAMSTRGKFMHFNGPVHTSTPTTNAGGDDHTDSNANSHFQPNSPHSILAELFLLIPEERLEQYPTKRVQVTPQLPLTTATTTFTSKLHRHSTKPHCMLHDRCHQQYI